MPGDGSHTLGVVATVSRARAACGGARAAARAAVAAAATAAAGACTGQVEANLAKMADV